MDVPVYSYATLSVSAGVTSYGQIFGNNAAGLNGTLSRIAAQIESAGTFRNFACYVTANTRTAGTATVGTYLSPSTVGNGAISIADTSTGWFEDTSNTDSFDDTELWAIRCVGFTTGVLTLSCFQGLWQPTTGQHQPLTNRLLDITGGTTTYYSPFAAEDNSVTSSNTNHGVNIPFAGTLRNLLVNVDGYTRTGGTYNRWGTYQVDSATAGNVLVNISATGAVEDTSNTDTVTAGERWCLRFTTDHTAGQVRSRPGARIELHATGSNFLFCATRDAGGGNSDVDCFIPVSCRSTRVGTVHDTRANMQHRADMAFTWSNLWANCLGAAAIIRSDINGSGGVGVGNGNQTITMAAGEVTDAVNTDAVAIGDLITWANDYQSGGAYMLGLSSMGSVAAGGTTIAPGAIGSGEAFGAARISQQIRSAAIGSGEAFGAHRLNLQIRPSALSSAEVFGSARVNLILRASGLASAESFGAHLVTSGNLVIQPTSLGSAEGFGAGRLNQQIRAQAIASLEAFGTARMVLFLRPPAIGSGEAFGLPVLVRGPVTIVVTGIASGEAIGAPVLVLVTGQTPREMFTATGRVFLIDATGRVFTVEATARPFMFNA